MSDLIPEGSNANELGNIRRQIQLLQRRLLDVCLGQQTDQGAFSVVLCRVGDQAGAFPLPFVKEVVNVASLTPIPESPPWVLGQLCLRGTVFPVVDVGARLTGQTRPIELNDLIVVTSINDQTAGFLVQDVTDVEHVGAGALQPATHDIAHAPYLLGVFLHQGRQVLVFNLFLLWYAPDNGQQSA